MSEKLAKHLTAGIAGLIALIAYSITMAPTVSFWDCGEVIASAYTLGIPHPPGIPFYIFSSRVAIVLLPMIEEIGKRVNYVTVFMSSAAIYVTVLFAWALILKIIKNPSRFALIVGSLSAGLLLAFSDTFWFNAVEAQPYGFAMFIVMLVSYLALLYLDCKDEPLGNRYLVLICYLGFLGLGIHLYTLITIPAIFILLLFANGTPIKTLIERWPLWITGTVLYSVIYNVSNFIWWSFILLITLSVAYFVLKKHRFHSDIALSLCFTIVALIGYSTYLYIPIRSSLNPVINENDPKIKIRDDAGNLNLGNLFKKESWAAFNDFVERKQYGSESMIARAFYRRAQLENQILVFAHMGYGGYQISQYLPYKVGEVNYYRPGIYSIEQEDNIPLERGALKFPTLMSSIGGNKLAQAAVFILFNGLLIWIIFIAFRRNRPVGIYLAMLYGFCSAGLLWYLNFSDGTKLEKREYDSWVSEMKYILPRLAESGAPTVVPNPNELLFLQQQIYNDAIRGEKSSPYEQVAAWQSWRKIQAAFKAAGAQPPPLPTPVHLEVRERDYFYSPAFMFMSLIYGVGIAIFLVSLSQKRPVLFKPAGIAIAILCGAVPLFANYKEHNRGNLWVPWDYAYNLLMSCEPNAILFTNGDNDTFPLWFAQEVAGIRKDVRVVNLSLGNTDWYIRQMLDNPPIMKLSYDKQRIVDEMVLSEKNISNPSQMISTWVNKAEQDISTLNRQIEILSKRLETAETREDSAKVEEDIEKRMLRLQVSTALKDWGSSRKSGIMQTQYKLVVDLALNNPDKPIHVSTTVGLSNAVGLDKYMVQKGMIWDLVKATLNESKDSLDVERTAYLADSVFRYRGLGDNTTYVNTETERLLFNYNSMYIRLAMALRDSIMAGMQPQEHLNKAVHYLDMGIRQFPSEWRNYAIAADLFLLVGNRDKAREYLLKGTENVSSNSFARYLAPQLDLLLDKSDKD